MRFQVGELVFVVRTTHLVPPATMEKYWAIVIGKPIENLWGGLNYDVFCSDGKKRVIAARDLRKPREVVPIEHT